MRVLETEGENSRQTELLLQARSRVDSQNWTKICSYGPIYDYFPNLSAVTIGMELCICNPKAESIHILAGCHVPPGCWVHSQACSL